MDRIAWDGDLLCFVEVRSRIGRAGGSPEESVGRSKRRRLVRAALAYLQGFPANSLPMVRFDVVSVLEGDGEPEIRVITNAFDANGDIW